jgi:hypothetical protein
VAGTAGLEPAISGVTSRCPDQLNDIPAIDAGVPVPTGSMVTDGDMVQHAPQFLQRYPLSTAPRV